MAKFTVKIDGLKEAQAHFKKAGDRIKNAKPVMEAAAARMETLILRGFRREASPFGTPWHDLSPTTEDSKEGSFRILTDTGRLKGSIFSKALTNTSMVLGSEGVPYARLHQFGGKNKVVSVPGFRRKSDGAEVRGHKRRLTHPARPFLPIAPSGDPSFIAGPAKTWLNKLVRELGNYIATGKISTQTGLAGVDRALGGGSG